MKNNKFLNEIANEKIESLNECAQKAANMINKENQDFIDSITPNTIVETVEDVKKGEYCVVEDDRGYSVGGSGVFKSKVTIIDDVPCYVCGLTEEEIAEDEQYIRVALRRGDIKLPKFGPLTISGRYITKVVTILGNPVLTVGHTEEERVEDETKARICYAKLRNGGHYDVITAEELIEAGLTPTKEFEKKGGRYIYFAKEKCARDFNGKKVADISDIKDKLSDDTAIEILKGRIEDVEEEEDEEDYDFGTSFFFDDEDDEEDSVISGHHFSHYNKEDDNWGR